MTERGPDAERLAANVADSFALAPHIGYDKAARNTHHAQAHGLSLREAALALGDVSATDCDRWVDPRRMALGEE